MTLLTTATGRTRSTAEQWNAGLDALRLLLSFAHHYSIKIAVVVVKRRNLLALLKNGSALRCVLR